MGRRRRAVTTLGLAGVGIVSERLSRPWRDRWGATDDEVTASLPGDQYVAEPATQVTRAITIDAPPEAVWPWLVQLGADRGGFYSYDWLENLFGLGVESAAAIVDEWQDLRVGDVVYATRSRTGGWYVVELDPDRAMVLEVADLAAGRPIRRDVPPYWEFSWTFALRPSAERGTRLLVRERVAFGVDTTRWLMTPVGLASFVMTRRMLIGIKARVEAAGTDVAASRSVRELHASRRRTHVM